MQQNQFHPGAVSTRRVWLRSMAGMGAGAVLAFPELRLAAQDLALQGKGFIEGRAVPDVEPTQLSKRVWMVFAKDGFPTAANQGMMANVVFVLTQAGVVVIDSGGSLQIGQMAIRMIRRVTPLPVVAVFNTHYHGDHWLGNHAFSQAFKGLPIYALAHTKAQIEGKEGSLWLSMMERWTNQATLGTEIVAPNQTVSPGQVMTFGDTQIRLHHYGQAHTPSDLSCEIVGENVTCIGDIAMNKRIANMDDGSYLGTFKYFAALKQAAGEQLWVPGHGHADKALLDNYGDFLQGIWQTCVAAVKEGVSLDAVKPLVLKDERVATRAKSMAGFDGNIGKYISLAYLEAEKEAF